MTRQPISLHQPMNTTPAKVIFKYNLPPLGLSTLTLPLRAKLLTVGLDADGYPAMWIEHDEPSVGGRKDPKEMCSFFVAFTGQALPAITEKLNYMGAVAARGYVWHLYSSLERRVTGM